LSRSERGSRTARWRSPRYDRYTEAVEIPLLALSVLLIPVLVLPEISKLGSAERGARRHRLWRMGSVHRRLPDPTRTRAQPHGLEHLSERQHTRLQAGLLAGDPHSEVELAWSCYQQLRAIYAGTASLRERRALAEKVIASFPSCPIPEVARLGPTLRAWRAQVLAYFATDGLSNGGTEAINMLIEKARRLSVIRPWLPQLRQLPLADAARRQRNTHQTIQDHLSVTTLRSDSRFDAAKKDPVSPSAWTSGRPRVEVAAVSQVDDELLGGQSELDGIGGPNSRSNPAPPQGCPAAAAGRRGQRAPARRTVVAHLDPASVAGTSQHPAVAGFVLLSRRLEQRDEFSLWLRRPLR